MKNCSLLSFIILHTIFYNPSCFAQTAPANGGRVTIIIEPAYNNQPLKLTDQYYIDGRRDTLFIDLFRFYMTNVKLSAGSAYIKYPDSHLIDAENTASQTFHIDNVPAGSFTALQFTIGVDSMANISGVHGGDLDTTKGMYSDSGYIMAKLEGRSKLCKIRHHEFEFHICGYMPPYNAAREINLGLPHPINVAGGKNIIIRIKADVAAWFKDIDLSKINDIVLPGKEASVIANNYAKMFSITEIKSKQL